MPENCILILILRINLTKVRRPYSHQHKKCHLAFFSQPTNEFLKRSNLTETLNK